MKYWYSKNRFENNLHILTIVLPQPEIKHSVDFGDIELHNTNLRLTLKGFTTVIFANEVQPCPVLLPDFDEIGHPVLTVFRKSY